MDRFIVQKLPRNRRYNKYLKSNMDRFIDFAYFEFPQPAEFKIQYRQIYRADYNVIIGKRSKFKIQYGQIYSYTRVVVSVLSYI